MLRLGVFVIFCLFIFIYLFVFNGPPIAKGIWRRYFFCGSFMGFFSVLRVLCLYVRLFICTLWSPAGKKLTSWLSFVVSYCEFVTLLLVSWVRYGTLLYRFLIFSPLLTSINNLERHEHLHVTIKKRLANILPILYAYQ